MSAVPIDQELPEAVPETSQNVVEEAMSWEYGLGREPIASPLDEAPAGP